jgi:hypothetical protein
MIWNSLFFLFPEEKRSMPGYNIVGRESNLDKGGQKIPSFLPAPPGADGLKGLRGFDLTAIRLFLTLDKGMTSPNSSPKPAWFPPVSADNEILPMFRIIRRND